MRNPQVRDSEEGERDLYPEELHRMGTKQKSPLIGKKKYRTDRRRGGKYASKKGKEWGAVCRQDGMTDSGSLQQLTVRGIRNADRYRYMAVIRGYYFRKP